LLELLLCFGGCYVVDWVELLRLSGLLLESNLNNLLGIYLILG